MELNLTKMEFDDHADSYHNENFDVFELTSLPDLDLKDIDPILNTGSSDSETMDVALKFNPTRSIDKFPDSPRGPPPRISFSGDLNFSVEVNSDDVHKKTFLYSHHLSRIYVDVKFDFNIRFNWDHSRAPHMFVRATVVFSDEAQAEKRVEKCVQHYQEGVNAKLQPEIAKNVLHSSREIGTQGVYYCGQPELADSWFSVLVEFRKGSPAPCSHAYRFMCKNSCTTGINRRAIAIIFTLEDRQGQIHGLQKIGTRVCACPRRDMLKDEESAGVYKAGKKKAPTNQELPTTKKIKIEKCDNLITLPPLQVSDVRTLATGLEVMSSMMRQAAELKAGGPQRVLADNIDDYLRNIGHKPPPPAE